MAHSIDPAHSQPADGDRDRDTEGRQGRAAEGGGREKEEPAHDLHDIELEITAAEGVIGFTTELMEPAAVHQAGDILVAPSHDPEHLIIWPRHAAASLLTAFALTINLSAHLHRRYPTESPPVTCGISTTLIVFSGQPGTTFRYGKPKVAYTIPSSGSLEILADSGVETYEVNGRSMPLNVWPADEFSARHVPVLTPKTNP
ncbi:MAG TPA: hypothetical protein VGR02_19705 [Thermoanaerobaculia bacterium]|jgi:hypothetical protein|nr:hypothetical protein [Thermoanaerobaculia bacterium]